MWYLLAPTVLGIAGGVLLRLLRGAHLPSLDRRSAALTAAAAGASSLAMVVYSLSAVFAVSGVIPLYAFPWDAYVAVRYLLPLLVGILAVLALGIPARNGSVSGAQLTRRTWTSFLGRSWILALLLALGVVVAVTVAAGLASQRDDAGHFTRYVVELGPGSMATTIYGWHLSVGPLVAVGVLLVATVVALAGIARPPHPEDLEADIARRRLRSANVARIATGALLLHLATVLRSVARTAGATLMVGAESGEQFRSGTSFAALAPVLQGAALLTGAIGLALWILTALSCRSRHDQTARQPASA
ncbi:hypothetical protein [Brachybacterium fresconis]|uniref:Integral membrane protein n=1 Tax=Brachybacterium fresconis TaxID=173363 RepID=A0ABS4YNU9_9MICO|nr:hypothetical protein [Brachybacterium fresconis]MBP2410467.1 hypothetical protein [Brachybacterium fresconis]